jgi:3-isopropylmalate/(R)-2-methylmalate dehydratase small subunit
LPDDDVDTDIIFPARFLLLLDRQGLGRYLFHDRRRASATGQPPFVLTRPSFDKAEILVAGRNFGCGSSREQAVWALADFGIRCVIAPSFGEIFFGNCFRNGVLPIVLPEAKHQRIMTAASIGETLMVDLEANIVRLPGCETIEFHVDAHRRRALLLGLDEIGAILADDVADIAVFESRQRLATPWLYLDCGKLAHFSDLQGETSLE